MSVLTPVRPHPKARHGSASFLAVPIHEAGGADFRSGDLVAVAAGLINRFLGAAGTTDPLAFAGADSRLHQPYIRASWPLGAGTIRDRGTIVYRMTDEDRLVMTVEGVTPDIQTIVGQLRDIAHNATFGFATVVATSANPRVRIESVLEGVNGGTNVLVICSPVTTAGRWF